MKSFTLKGIGKWLMLAMISLFAVATTNAQCTYSIELTDTFGDGWNGNTITVVTGGFSGTFTLASGAGPESFDFPVTTGDQITATYNQTGGWPYENGYTIYDALGQEVASEQGAFPDGPASVTLPGQCPPMGEIEGVVTYSDGSFADGVEVSIPDYVFGPQEVYTDASGYYKLVSIMVGTWDVFYFEDGTNLILKSITVTENNVTTQDVVMAPPLMVVNPLLLQKTMNPGEWLQDFIGIQNIGDGDLFWTAEIEFIADGPATVAMPVEPSPLTGLATQDDGTSRLTQETVQGNGSSRATCPDGSIFSAPFDGAIQNGQGSEEANGWMGAQHFTLTDNKKIGTARFYVVYLSPPVWPRPYTFRFWDDATPPPGDPIYQFGPVDMTGEDTGELLLGAYPVYSIDVAFGETVDLESGWFSQQSNDMNNGSPSYWCNTGATTEPSWFSVGAPTGAYAMCLGPAAGGAGSWLELAEYAGGVGANGGAENVAAMFNATGTMPGDVYNAMIHFTAQPGLSTTSVQATMIVNGEPITGIEEFTAELTDMANGTVEMSWVYPPERDVTFDYFLVRRNNLPVGNTQDLFFTDQLPTFGIYNYTVQAVFVEGESVPAGPEQVIWLVPEPCFTPDVASGEALSTFMWQNAEESVPFIIENCGEGVLSFEFPGFDDPDFSTDFVVDVSPNMGTLLEGESMDIMVTFASAGYPLGWSTTTIDLQTNALAPNDGIPVLCEMNVYESAAIDGTVTDCSSGAPIANATVRANSWAHGDFFGETDANGYFIIEVDPHFDPWGAYFLEINKMGYETAFVWGLNTWAGQTTPADPDQSILCETPHPVKWVDVDPNEEDTKAVVTWSEPMGPYEIIYDDGSAENYFAWAQASGVVAVKFTPAGYPATVNGGRLYVGDGSYPEGGNFIGTMMSVGVFDDDGENGMPGTVLDSVSVMVNNYGWVEFSGFNRTFADGNFYLGMWQVGFAPNVAPVGVDEQMPIAFRSYIKYPGADMWTSSPYQDFMVRATVTGPGDNVKSVQSEGKMIIPSKPSGFAHISMSAPTGAVGTEKVGKYKAVADLSADRDLDKYEIRFVFNFDPTQPIDPEGGNGSAEPRLPTTNNTFTDNQWGGQDPGFYAYGVKATYDAPAGSSEWVYSYPVAHLLDNVVTVNVSQCDGEAPANALVVLVGSDYPYQTLAGVTGETGTVVFDSVIDGTYDLAVTKTGYQPYTHPSFGIFDDHTEDVMMLQSTYPPRNLMVDPTTSFASWDAPLYIQLPTESFESEPYPPTGWTMVSPGTGWERTQDGSSGAWSVPGTPDGAGDWYIVSNDDQNIFNPQDDYMITPTLNLTEGSGYTLSFLLYYDAAWGQPPPEIVYSVDGGTVWESMWEATAGFDWQEIEIDLSGMSDMTTVKFALWAFDNGGWLSGVAADKFYVGNGPVEIEGYHVFLDDGFVTETDDETTSYQFNGLQYGTTYTASVAALYGCNLSARVYYTWTSGFLYPPLNVTNEYIYGGNEVPIFWNPPITIAGPAASFDASTYTPGTSPTFAQEVDPNGTIREVAFDRAVWDILYGFEMEGPSGATGLAGAETDGEFIYASVWSSADIVKFLPDGTYVETFSISGVSGLRDMAFDGMYVYGAAAANTVWQMDFTAQTMEGTINAPTACRAIAYDEDTDSFWGNNWDSPFTNFDRTGASLGSITVPSIYGAAFDNYNDGGPYIWVFSGTTSGGGAQVEQMDVTGAMTGEGHGVSGDFGSAGIAGGLYMDGQIVPGKMVLGGTMQGEGTPAFGYEMGDYSGGGGGPGAGTIPAGLASFNVYRDDANVGNVPYNGEEPDSDFEFRDNNIDPGTYDYTVTAVYDLASYGFPGQTAESPHAGPTTVDVVWGIDLPFMEAWDQGSFDFNAWRVSDANWVVNHEDGNSAPAAQFNWDPEPGAGYSISLASSPLNADMMTEGDIWLDFEVALNDRNASGDEKLAVEVYNGQDWTTVFEFTNASGSMDWTYQHLQITNNALGRVFQVRFTAMGEDSFDIVSWLVDNIYVYRTCAAPSNLDGDYVWNDEDDFGAEITWDAPDLPSLPEGWLYYHDGTIEYVWGSDTGDWESDIAMWFDPVDLADYPECAVTEVALFTDSRGANGGYVIAKVYEGPDAATLLYEEDISDQMLWNDDISYVTLATPVPFDNTKDLWIVFTTGGPIDVYVGGLTMELPAPARKGDLYRDAGQAWGHASDLGIGERAWILEAYVKQDYAPTAAPVKLVENREFVGNGSTALAPQGSTVTENRASSSRAFSGFNVYRMGPDETEYSYLDMVAYETGVNDYSYYDEDPFDGYPYEVCYQVTGVWTDDADYCESPPAKATIPIYDFVCIMVTSIDNPLSDGMTALYPNPATDRVNITSAQSIDRITIVNYVGQVVYDAEVNDERNVVLNTSNYDAGMYIVRINTANGVVTKRMTISN